MAQIHFEYAVKNETRPHPLGGQPVEQYFLQSIYTTSCNSNRLPQIFPGGVLVV